MIINKIVLYNKGLLRGFPCIITVAAVLAYSIFQIRVALYFGILNLIANILCHILKKSFTYLYKNIFKREYLPILGLGKRPNGAKNCSCFVDENTANKLSNTFGMPSGHCLSAVTTGVFWSLYIIDNYPNNNKRLLSLIILNVVCALVCISRIYLGCHTYRQVVVGSIIGAILGYYGYKIYKNTK